jgi:hypothetical protein
VVNPASATESRLENLITALKKISFPTYYQDGRATKEVVSLEEKNNYFIWAKPGDMVSAKAKITFHVT